MLLSLVLSLICAGAHADGDLRTYGMENLALKCQIEASSAAGALGAKYGVDSANDGDTTTWWASANLPTYPIEITLTFGKPVTIDTLAIVQADNPALYTNWKTVRLDFSDGTTVDEAMPDSSNPYLTRFEARETDWLTLTIAEPHAAARNYATLSEVMVFHDPDRKVKIKMPPTQAWKDADITPQGREIHPCVYITPEDVERAKDRLEKEEWVQKWFAGVRSQADWWLGKDEAWIESLLPEHGACFAYGFTGCPICRASWGTWGSARCNYDKPGKVTCANGHVLPDDDHPDPGTGYKGPDGRIHYFVGSWNAWVVETLQFKALANLVLTYTLTGEEKYAERAAFILDRLADLYPSCDAGSWDYPSTPPSGRFCRPWYQVARVLIHYADFYDQLFNSAALDKPSIREGVSRRENIEVNLLQDGATYCYKQSLKGRLHNGEADYVRGALAVGCCLGIPWYIDWAYDGPYGILSFVRNNVDRDGRYFETSAMYADHTRNLYLTFAEPMINYRSEKYPQGINLYDDRQFQTFYVLPQLSFNCIGKTPRFGDSGPDKERSFLPGKLTNAFDTDLAERLYARVSKPEDKARFASLLGYLAEGEPEGSPGARAEMPWFLFHGVDLPDGDAPKLDARISRRISESDVFGQKGFTFLRSGAGPSAQALLLRYGPRLNHGHADDLNINYYGLGYELTYDLGYGLGSTHSQVGWGKQTASHNLVMVDEEPQYIGKGGTGGSLHQFADLPGLQLTEASSNNSYYHLGVEAYRRLLALVGYGEDQYLIDIFRVAGGSQHDYSFHSLSDQATFEGVKLGEPAEGSLAGPDVKWGALQLNDGDMAGYPNRPYWDPPPGNGLGFLMEPQRAACEDNWSATWSLPDGDSFLRLTMLGQPNTEVISAWAPGIYPRLPKSRYAIARRKSDGPQDSTFIAAIEPYGRRVAGQQIDATRIEAAASVSAGSLKFISSIGALLHKAVAKGDALTWTFDVQKAGNYDIALTHYLSPAYGTVQFSVDGQDIGEPIEGTSAEAKPAPLARMGQMQLAAGKHSASLTFVSDDGTGQWWFGIKGLWLIPAGQEDGGEPKPFIREVLPVTCDDDAGPVKPAGAVVVLDDDPQTRDVLLSSGDTGQLRAFSQGDDQFMFRGMFAHIRTVGGSLVAMNLSGASKVSFGDVEIDCDDAEHTGSVASVDVEKAIVEVNVPLPDDGRLNGQMILFDNERYSRNTAHRIARVERTQNGSRIYLESSTLVLGTGILEDEPISESQFTSLLAHEYATSNSADGTQFFSGKLIRGDGFMTNIIRTDHSQLMGYTVDSTEGMGAGDEFVVYDVQPGDSFAIPTIAHFEVGADGVLSGTATTRVTIKRAGREIGCIQP